MKSTGPAPGGTRVRSAIPDRSSGAGDHQIRWRLAPHPGVVLTTSSAEEDILRSYRLNANAYVAKPVARDQFLEVVVSQIDEFLVQVVRLPTAK